MGRQKWLVVAVLSTALLSIGLVQPAGALTAKQVSINNSSSCTTGTLYCFVPMNTSVVTARTVTWTNHSSSIHTVTRCTPAACNNVGPGTGSDAGLGSSTIGASGTYSFTFHGLGTYNYYCSIHGYAVMHGTIKVDAAPTITSSSPTSLARGTSNATVHVVGTNFLKGVKAKFSGTGVTVNSTTLVDASHLTLSVTVASTATTGKRSLTVTNTDGGTNTKIGALSVT